MEDNIKQVEGDLKKTGEELLEKVDQTVVHATDKVTPLVVKAVDKVEELPKAVDDAINKATQK